MARIQVEYDGLSPESLHSKIEANALDQIENDLVRKVTGMKCAEHNQPPVLVLQGVDFKDLSVLVKGCCAPFRESVEARLKQ
jgi:hypothetical protein